MAVVALRRSTDVAWPVTTTSLSLKMSGSICTSCVDVPAPTTISTRACPIDRNCRRTSPCGAVIVYLPSGLVRAVR